MTTYCNFVARKRISARRLIWSVCLLLTVILLVPRIAQAQEPASTQARKLHIPTSVKFHKDTLARIGNEGDNWCMTWLPDGDILTCGDDNEWIMGLGRRHCHLFRLRGPHDGFKISEVANYPNFLREGSEIKKSWFGYGVLSVDGTIYSAISKTPDKSWSGPFLGMKLLKSTDNGKTWYRIDRNGKSRRLDPANDAHKLYNREEMFFFKESGRPHKTQMAYPFSYVNFVQAGKDNSAATDGYIYVYSPEMAHAHQLNLARVRKDKLDFRSEWEFFVKYENGKPVWSPRLHDRGVVHKFPARSADGERYFGWYSWLPSVVWNEGLGLYIMVTGGTYGGDGRSDSDDGYYHPWMALSGSLGFWHSKTPYGPWTEFFYEEEWTVDNKKNRTYQPKLSPKWISADGREMVLVWSDAQTNSEGRSHIINYKWNQMKVSLTTKTE